MSIICIPGGASGVGSDDCTARLSDVPAGLKAVTSDSNDEVGIGTMALTGNAQAGHVLAGETFYTNDYKSKLTGAMTVGSIMSFSAQAYSGRQILLKWQNPYVASGRPFSGVVIKYATWGYPAWDSGEPVIYYGYGNNSTPGGWSQVIVTMPELATAYYFTALSYVNTNFGDLYAPNYHANTVFNYSATTGGPIWLTFTTSQNYTIPTGYTKLDLFAVGGGSAGLYAFSRTVGSGGGGGGYTNTVTNISVAAGQVLSVIIGSGGTGIVGGTRSGSASYVNRASERLITANGGEQSSNTISVGMRGGSGGGAGGSGDRYNINGAAGGSNGAAGGNISGGSYGGSGQGTTTRAWGSGTIYSGGGGGGGYYYGSSYQGAGGAGGTGGGGAGGHAGNSGTSGISGQAGTGGGGGGAGSYYLSSESSTKNPGGNGGSGVVLLKLY